MKPDRKKTKKANSSTSILTSGIEENFFSKMHLLTALAFALIAGGLLIAYDSEYLFRAQELSLFLPTRLFWEQQMAVPGGFINYLGCFLTQFFYYPWLGTLFLTLLWLAILWVVQRTFRIPAKWALFTLIPVVALLASNTQLGYWLFHLKSPGYFFSGTLGYLAAMLAVYAFRNLSGWMQILWVALWTAFGYPLFGFYALLGSACMAAFCWKLATTNSMRLIISTTALLTIIASPLVWYYYFTQINMQYIYIAGLLRPFQFSSQYFFTWIPFIILTLFPFVAIVIYNTKPSGKVDHLGRYLIQQSIVLASIVFIIQLFWYRDPNFRAELAMNRHLDNLQWEKVLEVARNTEGEPTRLMIMNKNLALLKLGRAGDEMFKYPDGGKPPVAPFDIRMMQVGGKMLYYHYGKENFCYRWCLEDAVEFGIKVDYLKYMMKTSLISGEPELARKYVDILKKTLFWKEYALKYEAFLDNPSLMAKDPEFSSILPMMCYNDALDGDNTLVELYLLNYFSNSDGETKMFQEQTLIAALQMKDIQLFWPRFFRYAQLHKGERMPTHYQEAALLYGTLEKTVDISGMPFDAAVKTRFNEFMKLANNSKMSEEQMKTAFYSRFGDTFYYHYFFIRGVRSY